ncbi:flavoprotein [Streptomyces sp. UNOC14_S4]|uniref:flavoprotein n=1 Tax=Streptomyces sp. UNOC14_S4 TaxID=2872340 RepID=UPI001E42235F|nr:flavoprotein [Streptomyces sp. UNOC14_S4]MCC3769809.1 flavoprotein [Streptomyces sp. UNOC14_S4]
MTTRVLYLVACAALPVRRVDTGIRAAQAGGWDVCLILTPSAYRWATEDAEGEIARLEKLTGHPVRHQYKLPSQEDVLPPPDALLVAPLTANTLNKWAAGISDTLALGLVTEATGLGLPIVALPHWSEGQGRHPATARSVGALRVAGVQILLSEWGFLPGQRNAPGTEGGCDGYPWQAAVDALPGKS